LSFRPLTVGAGRERAGVAFSGWLTLDVLAVEATSVISDPQAAHVRVGGEQLVSEYLERWLAHVRGRVRTVTFEGYAGLIRRHALPRLGSTRIGELTPLDVQELYDSLLVDPAEGRRLAAGTVLNLHLVLTQAFGQAVRWRLLPSSPVAGAQPPRPRRPPRIVVDAALLERLLAAVAGTWLELPAAVAAATGMRRGEILALSWDACDEGLTTLRVRRTLQPTKEGLVFEEPKTPRSRRTVVLPRYLTPYLERQRADQRRRREEAGGGWEEHGLVVDRGDGRPVNPDTLSSAWSRRLRGRKLPPVRFHDLRHCHATLLLTQGVHPKVVSERLGHASVGITLDTYSHVLPTLQQGAAEAFDQLFPAGARVAAEA
jgi:integrase